MSEKNIPELMRIYADKVATINDDLALRNLGRSNAQSRPTQKSLIREGVTVFQAHREREICCDLIKTLNDIIDQRRAELAEEKRAESIEKCTQAMARIPADHPAAVLIREILE